MRAGLRDQPLGPVQEMVHFGEAGARGLNDFAQGTSGIHLPLTQRGRGAELSYEGANWFALLFATHDVGFLIR